MKKLLTAELIESEILSTSSQYNMKTTYLKNGMIPLTKS